MYFIPAEIIKKKRNNQELSKEEIEFFVNGFCANAVPDYQVSALLMAIYFNGMSPTETSALTSAMLNSGRTLNFDQMMTVDKHSTGGVGDKTSMILAPIVAAAGVPVPMIAGRGLGHTGGTLDKLESIPGFNINLTLEQFIRQIRSIGVAMIGQTSEICPADKKIYALRDVTATIESLPLICASIMSKKLAEGIRGLVLDVKFGSGAFMKHLDHAEQLAEKLSEIGVHQGKKVAYLLTDMNQPLGRFMGNALEIGECLSILKQESFMGYKSQEFADTTELSLELAGGMIFAGGKAASWEDGVQIATSMLHNGMAFNKFKEMVVAQGGDLEKIDYSSQKLSVLSKTDGYITEINTEKIGIACLALGAGRLQVSDKLDLAAGIEIHKKIGDSVRAGDKLYTLYANDVSKFNQAQDTLIANTTISTQKCAKPNLIMKRKTFGF